MDSQRGGVQFGGADVNGGGCADGRLLVVDEQFVADAGAGRNGSVDDYGYGEKWIQASAGMGMLKLAGGWELQF